MATSSSVAVGIIGAGSIAASMHVPTLLAMPDCRISWIIDAMQDRARSVAATYGLKDLPTPQRIADAPPVDAVLMALPLPPRQVYFDALLPQAATILAEKPLAGTAARHRELCKSFQPWRLAVGYQRRQYASYRLIRSMIERNVLGRLIGIRVSEGGRISRTGGGGTYMDLPIEQGGGIVLNLGCHSLDAVLWITSTSGFDILERQIEWDERTDRKGSARIRLRRTVGPVEQDSDLEWCVSWLDAQSNQMEFRFENAILTCLITPSETVTLSDKDGRPVGQLSTAAIGGALTAGQAIYFEWREIFAAVREKTEPTASANATLLTAEFMDALLA